MFPPVLTWVSKWCSAFKTTLTVVYTRHGGWIAKALCCCAHGHGLDNCEGISRMVVDQNVIYIFRFRIYLSCEFSVWAVLATSCVLSPSRCFSKLSAPFTALVNFFCGKTCFQRHWVDNKPLFFGQGICWIKVQICLLPVQKVTLKLLIEIVWLDSTGVERCTKLKINCQSLGPTSHVLELNPHLRS